MPDSHDEMEGADFFELAEFDGVHDEPLAPTADLNRGGEQLPTVGDDPSDTDIEQAYQKALAAMEDAGWGIEEWATSEPASTELNQAEREAQPDVSQVAPPGAAQLLDATSGDASPPNGSRSSGLHGSTADPGSSTAGPRLAPGTDPHPPVDPEEYSNVTPAQVIEAALFVGGIPLTPKKIGALLRNSFDVEFVERTIDELNDQYVAEGRPYEIRLGDGGYRLELRPEHEKLRQRVYGSGPREVKLSQDVLEVLALVAYRQPISQSEIESHGKQNAGNLLRQLLRRDLVAIQRGDGGRKDVSYLTTPRFLTVFGIGSLDELPQPDDLARK